MITIIVACDDMMGVGKDGKMPWKIREEMAHFRRETINNTVIMGRKTHESIGCTLRKRRNIVLTRDRGYVPFKGSEVALCKKEALDMASEYGSVAGGGIFIIGGSQIYDLFIEDAHRMLITRVRGDFDCDARFPFFDHDEFLESVFMEHKLFTVYELKRKLP